MKNKILMSAVLVSLLTMGQAIAGPTSLQTATITATYNGLASGINGFDVDFLATPNVSKLDLATGDYASEYNTADTLFDINFDKTGFLTITSASGTDLTAGSYAFTFDFGTTLTAEIVSGFSIVDGSTISASPVLSLINNHAVSFNVSLSPATTWASYSAVTAQLAFTPSAVPEPFAPAMLLAGLGVLGLSRRFSKK